MTAWFNTLVPLCLLLVGIKVVLSDVGVHAGHVFRETHVENTRASIKHTLNIYALVSSSVDNELCKKHSMWFQEGVLNNKLWALKMLDASSKMSSGILSGNGADLGDYDECLSVEDVVSESGRFSGQHCMVSLGEYSFANEINFLTRKNLLMEEEIHTDNNIVLEDWASRLSLLWSVCVPSTCAPRDIENHLRTALRPFLGNINVTILEGACNSNAFKLPLRAGDWLVLGIVIVILVLAVASTRYDLRSWKSGTRNELYLAFSLKLHHRRIMKVIPPTVDDLPVLWGVKVMSMLWIILLHFELITFLYPALNHLVINEAATCITCRLVSNGMAVDTFFLVSGLLACYNYLKDREKQLNFSLLRYYFHRYVRLTPAVFMMQLLTITLITIPGLFGGPMWRNNAAAFRRNCENYWYYNMLYITNYQSKDDMCLGHTWYLAVDMQLYLLSPLILYSLWRWPAIGKVLLCIISLLGAFVSVLVAYISDLKNNTVPDQGELGDLHYYPTHTRFTPWVIGIAVGYLLHHTKHAAPKISRWAVRGGWALSVLLMTSSLPFIYLMQQPDYRFVRLTSALYTGLMRPAWALGVAWLIFALSRGYGPRSMTSFLSLPFFQVLNRICYSIYLTHIAVIFFQIAHVRTPAYFHRITLGLGLLANIIVCIVIGAIYYLLVEAPPIYIEKVLFQRRQRLKIE